jgi:trimeric autotransporter adhesin
MMKKYIIIFLLLLISIQSYCQQWYPMDVGVTSIPQSPPYVFKITSYHGNITIGGRFKRSGSTILNGITQWISNQWQPMGIGVWMGDGGIPDSVGYASGFVDYNNKLFAVGAFGGAGGNYINDPSHVVNAIAKWDGTDWFPLTQPGDGFDSNSLGICEYYGKLYIGGHFGTAFDSSGATNGCEGIVRWNDTTFSTCGYFLGDFPPFGYDAALNFCVFQNKLITAGFFTSIDGSPYGSYSGIAAYDDTNWTALGVGFNDYAWGLAVLDGSLYAGGNFTKTRDNITTLNRIAKWDGANWLPLGDGFNDRVNVLCADTVNHLLYAGGEFTQSSTGQPLNHIAVWDGTNWAGVGGGADSAVYALYIKDSNLYVGGKFTHVGGGILANRIACWGHSPVGINETPAQSSSIALYPNPATNEIQITTTNAVMKEAHIYSMMGQCIHQSTITNLQSTIDISALPAGMYIAEVITEKGVIRKRFVKQ